jgi:ornithine decarboxylase
VIEKYFHEQQLNTPCLVLNIAQAKQNFQTLQQFVPNAKLYYAIKANPHPDILKCFIEEGAYFDAASINEIKLILSLGTTADRICYGNVAKKNKDIKEAYNLGVTRFVVDSIEELHKMAIFAPQSMIYIRISTSGANAVCPLSQKFGCHIERAIDLIGKAKDLDLIPYGIAFHVGSQQLSPLGWEAPIIDAATIFSEAAKKGIQLHSLDLGGGFPVPYHDEVPSIDVFTTTINQLLNQYFTKMPEIIFEPGRYLVGTAGTLFSEVVLATTKYANDEERRWVYLDIGVFGGLAEASDQLIQYDILSQKTGALIPTTLAGPTCDSMDIMYKKDKLHLPNDLATGDIVRFKNAGAYTTTYASIGFNGFTPLDVYSVQDIKHHVQTQEQKEELFDLV